MSTPYVVFDTFCLTSCNMSFGCKPYGCRDVEICVA